MSGLPSTIGGRYRPLRVLGRGGMGVVYEVEHIHTRERLALKVLGAADRARFRREARTFTSIRSDSVVRITDADTAPELDDAPYLVMELLDGVDLASLTKEHGAQAPADVARWISQAADGLEKAHAAGIIHRDLKPANLFLARSPGEEPRLKVLDFGVAKMAGSDDLRTQSGALVGTPRYMSPEQARGDGADVGPASDIWALGMIAFTLLHGGRYFDGDSMAQVIGQVLFDPIVAPSARGCDLGPAFDAWFLRACDRDPKARFSSVTEQSRELASALTGVPAPARAASVEAVPLDVTATTTGRSAGRLEDASQSARSVGTSPTEPARRPLPKWPLAFAGALALLFAGVLLARGGALRTASTPIAPSALPSADPPVVAVPDAPARTSEPIVSPVTSASASSAPSRARAAARAPVLDPFAGQK